MPAYAFPVPATPMKAKSPKKATNKTSPQKSKQSAFAPAFGSPCLPQADDEAAVEPVTPRGGKKKRQRPRTPSDDVSTNASDSATESGRSSPLPGSVFSKLRKEGSDDTLTSASNFYSALARSLSDKGFTTAREESLASSTSSAEGAPTPLRPKSRIDAGPSQNIKVSIRVRPCQDNKTSKTWILKDNGSIKLSSNDQHIKSKGPSLSADAYAFNFDAVHGAQSTTQSLYSGNVAPIVQSAIDGYNATIFAYGQTGSGKTHTMMGTETEMGVVQHAIDDIFTHINADSSRTYLLRVSYIEIYNEQLKDLFSSVNQKLEIRENKKSGIYVDPLTEKVVTTPAEVYAALEQGKVNRHIGATDWNAQSSRSHCVFTLTLESAPRIDANNPDAEISADETRISQLNLIDLAGSEKMSTTALAERNTEGSHINKSLLALGNVIAKLSAPGPKGHIPYRDSRLTRLLQTSLSGNARIAIVCTISADASQVAESLSTLKFARNAKLVVTKAERGTVANNDSALLQRYRKEIDELRGRLEDQNRNIAQAQESEQVEEERRRLGQLADERQKAETEIADMRQRRTQLSNELEHLQKLLLTGSEVAKEEAFRNPEVLHGLAGPPQSASRHAYYRRVSAIGVQGHRALSAIPLSSERAVSTALDSITGPRVPSADKEAELQKRIEGLESELRAKDDELFKKATQCKTTQAELDFAREDLKSKTTAELSALRKANELKQQEIAKLQAEIENLRSVPNTPPQSTSDVVKTQTEMQTAVTLAEQRKSEIDQLQAKLAATAVFMADLQSSRDQADSRVEEVAVECKSLREKLAQVQKSEGAAQAQALSERQAANKHKRALSEANIRLEAQQLQLTTAQSLAEKSQADLAVKTIEITKLNAELTKLRESRKPQLPHTIYGPTAGDLAARVEALSSSTARNSRGVSSGRMTPVNSADDAKVRQLQDTVSELRSQLARLETEARSKQQPESVSALQAQAYREELLRMNEVVEGQKETIAECRSDLMIWRQRVTDQAALIQGLQGERAPSYGAMTGFPTYSPPRRQLEKAETSPRKAKPSLYDDSAMSSPRSQPLSYNMANSSPSNSPSRKTRKFTIESDICKLESNRPVERNRSILMTPRAATQKKRILTGIHDRQIQRASGSENIALSEAADDRDWYV